MLDHLVKKLTLILVFPVLHFVATAQGNQFQQVDLHAASIKEKPTDAATLAQKLTEPFTTDLEKSRAIFMWIALNVQYDCKKFHNPQRPQIRATSKKELKEKVEKWQEDQVEKTAKSKRGICEDYSRLFKAMCDVAGVEAVVVSGNARDFYRPYRSAHNNPHAWNAVKIDGQWHLLDATWAAGYVNAGVTKFTRKLFPGYFMTPPAWFAQYHFPDDEKWQLLDTPLDKSVFPNQPMINFGQQEYPFIDFPQKIAAVEGKGYDRELRIKLGKQPKYFAIATRKGKPIKHTRSTEDGYEVFRFSSRGVRDLVLFGGESQKKMGWLGKYDL